tara:strand:- start:57 stop:761 length:705 start_codon:yes stop_codon:yes gene_type:complete
MIKNLALAFCSLRPDQYPEEVRDTREREYLISLKQLKRVLPKSFDLLICENTIDDIEQIKDKELSEFLSDSEMCAMGSSGNIGTKNKGLGEFAMLKSALDQTDIDKYKHISYVTARRIFTCPYVFEKTEKLKKQALLSNPDFLYLNGKLTESFKGPLFNDMFFSMKSDLMVQYADYSISRVDYLSDNHIGSEYNLHNFITENNIDYDWLEWLGMVRNDWEVNGNPLDISNFHIC